MDNIKLSNISVSINPRKHFDERKMQDLVASVKEKGVIVPILVRPVNGRYEVVYGERRFKAAQTVGLMEIPVTCQALDDKQVLEFQMIENLQREDIHPLEEAEGYESLMKKHGYKTADDIAVKVGKSRTYIYGRLKLLELILENRKLFYNDKFSPSVALLVSRIPKDLQKEAGKNIALGGIESYARSGEPMSYRKAQKYITEDFMLQLKGAPFDTKDKTLGGKAGPCTICLKRTGNQKELFPDIQSADVCTDPTCFKMKKNAFMQRILEKLKASGKVILPLDESKKLFRYEHDETPDNKYLNIKERSYYGNKYMALQQVLKATKDVNIIYAIQPFSGKLIEMIDKAELPKVLKAAGIKVADESTGRSGKDLAKTKTHNRIREAKRGFWIDKVSTAKDRRCMNVVILDILLSDLGTGTANALLPFKTRESYYSSWSIPKLYELGDEVVQKLIVKVISKKSEYLQDEDLKFLSAKLGFDVAKDYMITEAYLQACTKDQLGKLAKELGIGNKSEVMDEDKKSGMVAAIFKHAPKGKVPKELVK